MAIGLDCPRSNYNNIRSVCLVMKHVDTQITVLVMYVKQLLLHSEHNMQDTSSKQGAS